MQTDPSSGHLQLQFSASGADHTWEIADLEIRAAATSLTVSDGFGGSQTSDGTTVDQYTVTGATASAAYMLSTNLGTIVGVSNSSTPAGPYSVPADSEGHFAGYQFTPTSGTFYVYVQRPITVGTLNLSVADVTGAPEGTGTQVYSSPVSAGTLTGRIDFNAGTAGSPTPTSAGFSGVVSSTTYTAALGYGWVTPTAAGGYDRGASVSALRRDGNYGTAATPGTFEFAVNPSLQYNVRVYVGDPSYARDSIQVTVEGATAYTVSLEQTSSTRGRRHRRSPLPATAS